DWATQSDGTLRRYSYQYDGVNRLKEGNYSDNAGAAAGSYAEKLNYDLNGNITGLQRTGQGAGVMDQLSYTYDQAGNSNKLIRVNDASGNAAGYPVGGNTIAYDINGNMVNHLDKGISNIAYNYLNLPSSITASIGNTDYVYRADGSKVKKVFGGKTTDYLDGFQYENGVLQFVPTAEGYYDLTKNKYIYNYTDHLGNIRLSYTKGASGGAEIIEENNYYPFGLKHQGYNSNSLANNAYQYKYNGKELQETGMYDYGARMYMPELGRWGVVDPLAEKYPHISPYNYVTNNPIKYIDPTGMWIDIKDGNNTYRYNNGKLYTQNAETKKWDVETSVKNDSYAGQILSALTSITGGDENSFGSQYLNLFANDDINTTIKDSSLNGSNAGKNGATLDGSIVFTSFNQDVTLDTTSGSKKSPFHVTLFHELGHSLSNQIFDNSILRSEWTTIPQEVGDKKIPKSEIYASTIENVLRAEQNIPLRMNYTPETTNTQLIQKVSTIPLINNTIYKLNPATQNIFNSIIQSKK
ncbi:RHS repeat-associated core domain-containing protein, partial [Elizabethkingia occulta]